MNQINKADVVVGLAWGDEGKGKVTAKLSETGNYDFVCRWAGGSNAGHTVYVDDKKYATHIIPSGVFHGIKSIIGPGCALNTQKFFNELIYLKTNGFDIDLIKVSPRTHIVTDNHIRTDKQSLAKKLGTTSNGIAPCYAAKAARTGILARDVLHEKFIWDENLYGDVLCEGAQGVWLDLDWGNYPYITSSTTLPYGACSLGIAPQKIKTIYGVAKIYDTRSGIDPKFPEHLLFDHALAQIAEIGQEIGVTTGRKRKVNWLNLNLLIQSINITGTTDLIINKCDILETAKWYSLIYDEDILTFSDMKAMKKFIKTKIINNCDLIKNINFSSSPTDI